MRYGIESPLPNVSQSQPVKHVEHQVMSGPQGIGYHVAVIHVGGKVMKGIEMITCNQCGYTRTLWEIPRLVLGGIQENFITTVPTYPEDPGCPNCAMKDTKESF